MAKNLSSIYNIKDYIISTVAPKYFDTDKINDLNIGLLGMTTELVANATEDTFNTITTYLNEMHPNLAILPESIYNQAALFQNSNLFAESAEMSAWLFLNEKYILNNMESINSGTENIYKFVIDSNMVVDVEGVQYMLDYDISISIKEKSVRDTIRENEKDYIYNAQYIKTRYGTSFTNDLSDIASGGTPPYIKSKRIYYQNEAYIAMMVDMHQLIRHRVDETVINNTVLNAASFTINVDGEIAGFNVFCKLSTDTGYTQLTKLMLGSPAVKGVPFCYYRLTDENELEISFTLKDGYYKPDFGTELIIEYYTTLGTEGNFDLYTGENIIASCSSDTYQYNNGMVIYCIPHSDSKYGTDNISVDDLRNENVENFSTVKSYTTENDLQMYFSRFVRYNNIKTYTVKRRDDIERIFSTFTRYIGNDGDIIRANTCMLGINSFVAKDSDGIVTAIHDGYAMFNDIVGTTRYIRPGQLFVYDGDSNTYVNDINSSDVHSSYRISIPETLVAGNYWVLIGATRYGFTTLETINPDTDSIMMVRRMVGDVEMWYAYCEKGFTKTELGVSAGVPMEFGERLFYTLPYHFIFATPYLITITASPTVVGYYLNTINKKYTIDYKSVNEDSFDQFMCNSITIKRNAINGTTEDRTKYTISAFITPTLQYDNIVNSEMNTITNKLGSFDIDTGNIVNDDYLVSITGTIVAGQYYINVGDRHFAFTTEMDVTTADSIIINLGSMKVFYSSTHPNGIDIDELELTIATSVEGMTQLACTNYILNRFTLQFVMGESVYILMNVTHYDKDASIYTMTGYLTTTDILDTDNFQVTNVYSFNDTIGTNFESGTVLQTAQIRMNDCPITINARLTSIADINDDIDDVSILTKVITNVYTTRDNMTFIYPLNMVRSNIKFSKARVIEINPTLDEGISIDEYNAMRDIVIDSFPLVAESVIDDNDKLEELISYFADQYEYIQGISRKITGNHTIDLKFYNTYGRSKNFELEDGNLIDSVNVGIVFKIKPDYGTDTDKLVSDIKIVIKEYIETINDGGGNSVYVSNIIQLIENQFSAVKYVKFGGIKGTRTYDLDNQTIENIAADIDTLTADQRRNYVPEYLNVSVDDIDITII